MMEFARSTGSVFYFVVGLVRFLLSAIASWPIGADEWPRWLDWPH